MAALIVTPLVSTALPMPKVNVPDNRKPSKRTTSASLKDKYFSKQVASWPDFEQTVEKELKSYTGVQSLNDLTSPGGLNANYPTSCALKGDSTECGNEISLQGRFTNNALEPAREAVDQLGTKGVTGISNIHVGDGKLAAVQLDDGRQLDPDLAICTARSLPICVGEMKTLWTIGPLQAAQDLFDRQNRRLNYGKVVGQLVTYMLAYGCKYGFLSTYEDTQFFRIVTKSTSTSYELQKSSTFKHSGARQPVQSPGVVRTSRVLSVKQILLWMMLKASRHADLELIEYPDGLVDHWVRDIREKSPDSGEKRRDFQAGSSSTNPSSKQQRGGSSAGASGGNVSDRERSVLVSPQNAWRVREEKGRFHKGWQLESPRNGWIDFDVTKIREDSRGRKYLWQTNGGHGGGCVYVRVC